MNRFENLHKLATMLINENNDLLVEAEQHLNDEDLTLFAAILTEAGEKVAEAAKLVASKQQVLTELEVEELGALAQSLDDTNDPVLQKQASLIDELLITVSADPKAQMAFKKADDEEIQRLRAKYQDTRGHHEYHVAKEQHDKENHVNEAIKSVEQKIKAYRPLEAPLSTRYSPDMPGVSLVRVGDNVYQCPVTKKIYDFRAGYTTMKGNKIPGSDVSNQTQHLSRQVQEHMNFGTREEALNKY